MAAQHNAPPMETKDGQLKIGHGYEPTAKRGLLCTNRGVLD